jgi:hypothetical protein
LVTQIGKALKPEHNIMPPGQLERVVKDAMLEFFNPPTHSSDV